MKKHSIAIIGSGYVGLVTGACFAKLGHAVTCHDIDKRKIRNLQKGIAPFFEPGLTSLIKETVKKGNLRFSSDLSEALYGVSVIFITVGTPSNKDGSVDLTYVKAAVKDIASHMRGGEILVSKSTVPIGTSLLIRRIVSKRFSGKFSVVSNPEFLQEAVAIKAFLEPDRIIMGYEDLVTPKVKKTIKDLYAKVKAPIIETDNRTAELIKYAANVFLTSQISFINSIARLCEEIGADVELVAKALKADKRIGQRAFINAGIGYGGLCFPKDIRALIRISERIGYKFKFLDVVEEVNKEQRAVFVEKMKRLVPKIRGKKIALLGLSFKPKTDDMREAPSIDIVKRLQKLGAKIHATDPVAITNAKQIFGKSITYHKNPYSAIKGAYVVGIITEWPQYKKLNLQKVKRLLRLPNIVDGRNIYEPDKMRRAGFNYLAMGRGYIRDIKVK